jgi:hypothetical protein
LEKRLRYQLGTVLFITQLEKVYILEEPKDTHIKEPVASLQFKPEFCVGKVTS